MPYKSNLKLKDSLKILLLVSLPFLSSAQDYKIQSLFVYNFAKHIEWPADQQKGDFVVGVLGNSAAVDQFKASMGSKSKGVQKIIVQDLANGNAFDKCHIIFIASEQTGQLTKIKQAIGAANVLIVTEKDGSIKQGRSINMFLKNGKMAFEINQLIKSSSLKISAEILRLAQS
jgi:YfiR/HmsC-like